MTQKASPEEIAFVHKTLLEASPEELRSIFDRFLEQIGAEDEAFKKEFRRLADGIIDAAIVESN